MLQMLESSWHHLLSNEFKKEYYKKLSLYIDTAYSSEVVYPPQAHIFNAFELCSFSNVRVVIVGQDPYPGAGQAHGLAFSVPDGIPIPPSLRNIFKEIETDVQQSTPNSSNLERWAKQGVLLLNSTLTVTANVPGSHQGLGWETFTDTVIKKISEEKTNVVFLLWGAYAQSKRNLINESKHLVLIAPHPSPLSSYRGFFGCKHFSKTNEYLERHGQTPIIW